MELFQVDDHGSLFISPAISDWETLVQRSVDTVIDLDGDLDSGVPTMPNQCLYIYFPIFDEDLPNLHKLHAVATLGATVVRAGHRVLSHCGMGFNRSALIAGVMASALGLDGILVASLVLLGIAVVPLTSLRRYEHYLAGPESPAALD